MSLSYVNIASAYAVGLRLTMQAADLSKPILDCGRNAKRKEGRLLDNVHMCRPNYMLLLLLFVKYVLL